MTVVVVAVVVVVGVVVTTVLRRLSVLTAMFFFVIADVRRGRRFHFRSRGVRCQNLRRDENWSRLRLLG